MIYNFYKIKILLKSPDNSKIKTLTDSNYKIQIKKGIVLIDFWAPWCTPCKMIAPVLNDLAETESERFMIAKVNIDKEQQLSKKYNISSIPTIVMFNDGKEVKRFSGIKTRKFLIKEVDKFINTKHIN